jgi:hypothetical protein
MLRRCTLLLLAPLLLAGCGRDASAPQLAAKSAPKAADAAAAVEPADLVFLNGYVYTADTNRTVAQAIAVRGDRIVFVGSNAEARTHVGPDTTVHGLDERMVLPGLHDVHIHLFGLPEPDTCTLDSQPLSLDDMVGKVKECLDGREPGDGWHFVEQWNFAIGNQPSARHPTLRAALDAISPRVPLLLRGNDGHHAAVNSAALRRAVAPDGTVVGLSRQTIAGHFAGLRAYIGVDARGEPDGTLSEDARLLVRAPDLWGFSTLAPERMPEISAILAQSGITSVMDAALDPAVLPQFEALAGQNQMTFRMTAALFPALDPYRGKDGRVDLDRLLADLRTVRDHYRNHPTIKSDAAKIFIDGVLEGNPFADPPALPNSAVLEPYLQPQFRFDPASESLELAGYVDTGGAVCADTRAHPERFRRERDITEFRTAHGHLPAQCTQSRGVLEHDEAFIRNYMRALHENGFAIHAHAIGDRAVRVAVANFAALIDEYGEHSLPHSIAHAQLVHPADQARIGELGILVAFTYAWIRPDFLYDMSVNPFLGKVSIAGGLYDRNSYAMRNLYPVRGIADHGDVLAAGSDAPVDTRDPRPFVNIAQAVTRADETGHALNADQSIDVHTAIAAYTRNGARALRQQELTGTIEAGRKADFIVLDQNLVELANSGAAARIASTQVLLTLFDGRIVYQAD